jgi:hypothetical protein
MITAICNNNYYKACGMSTPNSPSRENKTRIKVFVRCRPAKEDEDVDSGVVLNSEDNKIVIKRKGAQDKDYDFDRVFGTEETQETVFKDVAMEAIDVI